MKVKDLIKLLQKVKNQNAIVVKTTDNFEQGNAKVEASGLYLFNGEIKEESFRDAFDGGSYNKKIVKWNEKGKQEFLEIN